MRKQCSVRFEDITAPENLLQAWQEFCSGKRKALDVQRFERNLADNLLALHSELADGSYRHGSYYRFSINDPKPRVIHKAGVRDRLVHHAIYRKLYPFFDKTFIADSYSCRIDKGTHKAMGRFKHFSHQLSHNNTKTVWVLKCDIRKFFDSIDHETLLKFLHERIAEEAVFALLKQIVASFPVTDGKGLPLGNLTSQLFVNIYMNEFDQWVKHKLRARHYIRYADDFVFLSNDRQALADIIPHIAHFLGQHLRLQLHPTKLFLSTAASGMDFLGWVHFPTHRVVRTAMKRRMIKNILAKPEPAVFDSYQGLLKHGNAYELSREVENLRGLLGEQV